MAVAYSTPQLVSASSNTATGNVTGLDGGKRLLIAITCRAASVTAPTTLTVGGVSATLVSVGGVDAEFTIAAGRYLALYEILAVNAPGSGTQSCTITWTSADRVAMWVTELTGDDGSFVDLDIVTGTTSATASVDSTATGQSLFSICSRAGTGTYSWTTSTSDEIAEGGAAGTTLAIGALTLGAAGTHTSAWAVTGGTGQFVVFGAVIGEASAGSNYGITTETGTALALVGSDHATYGLTTEAGTALALADSDPAAYGLTTETGLALALVEAAVPAYGITTEVGQALALVGADHAVYGVTTETGAALALSGADLAAFGIATETGTALALVGSLAASYGVATETGLALALVAVGAHSLAPPDRTLYDEDGDLTMSDLAHLATVYDATADLTFAD